MFLFTYLVYNSGRHLNKDASSTPETNLTNTTELVYIMLYIPGHPNVMFLSLENYMLTPIIETLV